MSKFHQPYSELRKMPISDIDFCLALGMAEDGYIAQQYDRLKK